MIILQEDITFVNICESNIGTPKCIKQIFTDIKGETDSNKIIVGDLVPHFHKWIDHPDRKSIKKHQPEITNY